MPADPRLANSGSAQPHSYARLPWAADQARARSDHRSGTTTSHYRLDLSPSRSAASSDGYRSDPASTSVASLPASGPTDAPVDDPAVKLDVRRIHVVRIVATQQGHASALDQPAD